MVEIEGLVYVEGVRISTGILLLTLMICGLVGEAVAQESDAPEPTRVVVSPFVYVRPGAVGRMSAEQAREAAREGMHRHVARTDRNFTIVPFTEVESRITEGETHADEVRIAENWAKLGMKKYRELQAQEAVENLREAYGQYRQAHHQLVEPRQVAEVVMFLALAALEQGGDVAEPLELMKEMIVLEPSRVVREGVFPEEVVQFYESARLTFEREIREVGSRAHPSAAIAEAGDADVVLSANLLPNPDGSIDVVVWRWEASDQRYTDAERLRVTSPDAERIASATNRLASRHLAVLVEPPPEASGSGELRSSEGLSPFSLDLSFAYASYLEFPDVPLEDGTFEDVYPFANPGATIGASFRLTREFALVAAFQFLSSVRDHDGVVRGGFPTLRWFAGGEVGADIWRLRASVAAAAEVTAVGQIELCTDADLGRPNCTSRRTWDSRILSGINVRPRLGLRIIDPLTFWVSGSSTFYFLPLAGNDVNFLTAFESGFTYRF
jgi:hypothetical protein